MIYEKIIYLQKYNSNYSRQLFSMNEHYLRCNIFQQKYCTKIFLRLVKCVPTVSCSETTRTFPFLFHGSENNRSRVNSVLLYAVCSLLFSPTLIFRISAHSCAIDRRYRTNVPKRSTYRQSRRFLVCRS